MAEVEEPQFTSLSARIAALNQQGMGRSSNGQTTTGKRPPPPLPPSANRPGLHSRGQTTNNPPIVTYGSSSTKQSNNLPIGVKGNAFLPPPPVDRDQAQDTFPAVKKSPSLPARNAPPPLPTRKSTQPSPNLPARNTSTAMVRRGSNASTMSHSSSVSGMSLSQTGSTGTSISSTDSQRKLPPALGDAKLPPLPPSRRDLEEKAKAGKVPLVTVKSAPTIPIRQPPVVERDIPPKMPLRPNPPPRVPSRPTSRNNLAEENEKSQLQRRLPPPTTAVKSVLSMGFKNKANAETPNIPPRPMPVISRQPQTAPIVHELTPDNWDSIVVPGKFALVDFYLPHCKYCVELEPVWKQLGDNFAFASDRLVIAKMDVYKYKSFDDRFQLQEYPTMMFFDGSGAAPYKFPFNPDLGPIQDMLEERSGILASDASKVVKPNGTPPPINLSSKPSVSQVRAIQARPAAIAPRPSGCLLCRDFSGPDRIAAQHPRQSIPNTHDTTGYLAGVLCGPFSSATDKARAIFTWLHHNIAYDTETFFANRVKYVDPKDTISSGLAVCGGYAGVFTAIALKAGLEAVMVSGHGKGYGYSAMQPGDPVPPCKPEGHAWNAVRIDNGEWKLLDSCWGSGSLSGQVYKKSFTPTYFTMSNDDFGIKHFPQDSNHFYRSDGRPMTWEQYMLGPTGSEPLQLFGSVEGHGLSPTSFTPPQKRIPVNSNETIRFQFSKLCEHWDHEKNGQGKPYCMILKIGGADGRKDDYVAFESNDFWWWADVKARDLGAPGQKITCYAVTTVRGEDARGMTRQEYLGKKGKQAMGFGGVAAWDLV